MWFRTTPRICSMNWSIRSGVPTLTRRSLPRLGGFYPADQPTVASIRTLRGAARCPRLICAYALPQPSRPSSTASAPRPIPIYPSRSDGVAIRHRWLPGANRGGAKRKRQEKKGCGSEPHPSAVWRRCLRCPAYSFCKNSANSFSRDARRSTDSGTWIRTFARPSASKLSVAAFLFLTVNVWGFAST